MLCCAAIVILFSCSIIAQLSSFDLEKKNYDDGHLLHCCLLSNHNLLQNPILILFSLVRNNPERNVGAAGTLQDLNVAISRSKEKLIILGNFDMMLNGWAGSASINGRHYYKSPARKLARLIDSKYGRVVDAPQMTVC